MILKVLSQKLGSHKIEPFLVKWQTQNDELFRKNQWTYKIMGSEVSRSGSNLRGQFAKDSRKALFFPQRIVVSG